MRFEPSPAHTLWLQAVQVRHLHHVVQRQAPVAKPRADAHGGAAVHLPGALTLTSTLVACSGPVSVGTCVSTRATNGSVATSATRASHRAIIYRTTRFRTPGINPSRARSVLLYFDKFVSGAWWNSHRRDPLLSLSSFLETRATHEPVRFEHETIMRLI